MTLAERPLLLTCGNKPSPHIRVLWGVQYVTPSFARATPEDGKVLAFARDVRLGTPPHNRGSPGRLAHSVVRTGPDHCGAQCRPRGYGASNDPTHRRRRGLRHGGGLQDHHCPDGLGTPVVGSPFLTPINTWDMITTREASLRLEHRVIPLLQWLRAQTSAHTGTVSALSKVDLADATLQARKELRYRIIPPPPLAKSHTIVQFLPSRIQAAAAPPPETNQVVSAEDRWGYTISSLLRLCNVTAPANLPPIWYVISPFSRDRV